VPPGPAPELDRRILRGSAWVALGHFSRSGLAIVSLAILARLLAPKEFGLVALAYVFVHLLEFLQGAGIGAALIYRREDLRRAADSALVFSMAAGVAMFGACFFAAPIYARIVDTPEVTDVMRVLALMLLIRSVGVVPLAIIESSMNFRARTNGDVASSVTQLAVSVALAYAGFGVWSLVIGQLAAVGAQTLLYWIQIPWRPVPRRIDWPLLREILRYGRFVTGGNLLNVSITIVQNGMVGRMLGATPLGAFWIAFRLANVASAALGNVVNRVMVPAYSIMKNDPQAFRRAFVQNVERVALLALPVTVILAVAAEPIVFTLFGSRWDEAVTPLRLIAVYGFVRAFSAIAGPVFMGLGKPHLVPIWVIPNAVTVFPFFLLLTPAYGVSGAALALLLSFSVSGIPAMVVGARLLEVPLVQLLRALWPMLASSAASALVMVALLPASDSLPSAAAAILLVAAGGLAYVVGVALFARATLAPLWVSLRSRRPRDVGAGA
jgi:PST family polysaccharide transporter